MIELKAILAPTDFSLHAEAAVKYACGLAEQFGATLHLLHVLNEVVQVGPDPMMAPMLPPDFYRESEETSQKALGELLQADWGRPRAVETAVRWGVPVEVIVDYAASLKVDMIVVATHGRTGLSHVLLGSVAERIVREAPCPVLTIRDSRRG